MDPAYMVTFWFTAGIFLHIAPRLPTLTDVRNFVFILIGSLFISLLPEKNENEYNMHDHLVKFFLFSVGLTFLTFRDKLIPKINEHIVAVHTVILCYAVVFLIPDRFFGAVIAIAVIPTGLLINSIIEKHELDHMTQVVLYYWNDAIYLMLFCVQYVEFTKLIPSFDVAARMPVIQIITSGMMFASFAIPACGILFIIPIPGKRQTFPERMAEIREYMYKITEKFTEENSSPAKVIFIAILSWGILYLNKLYGIVSEFTLINILIIGLPLIIRPSKPEPVPARILSMEHMIAEK